MPPYNWPVNAIDLIQKFEARHNSPAASALFFWAVSAVDSLYYLDDIDLEFDTSRQHLLGHVRDVIDISHAWWATGTSITALDLCAAGLGRVFCGHTGNYELDLRILILVRNDRKLQQSVAPNCHNKLKSGLTG